MVNWMPRSACRVFTHGRNATVVPLRAGLPPAVRIGSVGTRSCGGAPRMRVAATVNQMDSHCLASVSRAPVSAAGVTHVGNQQECLQTLPCLLQILFGRAPGTHQITERLVLDRRHVRRREIPRHAAIAPAWPHRGNQFSLARQASWESVTARRPCKYDLCPSVGGAVRTHTIRPHSQTPRGTPWTACAYKAGGARQLGSPLVLPHEGMLPEE